MDIEKSVAELVRRAEEDYISGTTTTGKYVDFSQYENIEKIHAYLNSKHISGSEDSMGRPKPFFNIVTAAVNIWYRATDIDRKNIRIKASNKSETVGAFLASVHLWNWMKKSKFGIFLNDWGRTLASYGSAVVKFVEADGKLTAQVVPWNRLITDTVDFENNLVIEKLYFTPAQLRMNESYDQEMVESLIEARVSRKTQDRQNKDNKSEYIEVYEVHGNIPLAHLTDDWDNDDKTYKQQMHVISFVGKRSGRRKDYEDFTLYKGKEAKSPYMLTHLIKEDGRAQAIGAVEHLFEAQWMMNHTAKEIKDQLDLASKLIFQTSDGNFVGRNVLTAVENGDILIHNAEAPLTQIANNSHDITSLQNFAAQWQGLAKEITSTPDSISGNTMPSGTAYRQVAILNQESHSLFEIMTENKGLAIEEMMRIYVLPYLKKQMDTTDEIVATLDDRGIMEFDSMFVPSEATKIANDLVKKQILSGQIANNVDVNQIALGVKQGLAQDGNKRFIKPSEIPSKTWKELFKDLEWDVDVEVTNENTDKEVVLTTLSSVLQTIVGNPAVLQDPNAKMLFNKILEETGRISPLELAQVSAQPQPQQANQPIEIK